jgi:hypothetical protein
MTTLRLARRRLPWVAGAALGLLLAPGVAGTLIVAFADARTTSFHWRLQVNYGQNAEGWTTPDSAPMMVYPDAAIDPRAWRRLGVPYLVGLERRADGSLAWHVEGLGLVNGGDAWIGLDGHPGSVELRETNFYPKGSPGVFVDTFTYDDFDQAPPPSPPQPPPDRAGGAGAR